MSRARLGSGVCGGDRIRAISPATATSSPAGYVSRQGHAESFFAVPLDAPASVLRHRVREATAPLYSALSGFAMGPGLVENPTDQASRKFRRAST